MDEDATTLFNTIYVPEFRETFITKCTELDIYPYTLLKMIKSPEGNNVKIFMQTHHNSHKLNQIVNFVHNSKTCFVKPLHEIAYRLLYNIKIWMAVVYFAEQFYVTIEELDITKFFRQLNCDKMTGKRLKYFCTKYSFHAIIRMHNAYDEGMCYKELRHDFYECLSHFLFNNPIYYLVGQRRIPHRKIMDVAFPANYDEFYENQIKLIKSIHYFWTLHAKCCIINIMEVSQNNHATTNIDSVFADNYVVRSIVNNISNYEDV
jgi:hypothetical protein